jgi:hypothetical protein
MTLSVPGWMWLHNGPPRIPPSPVGCAPLQGQIDNFATAKEGQDWLRTPAFDRNPIGIEYDPDELVARFKAGVPMAELVARDR